MSEITVEVYGIYQGENKEYLLDSFSYGSDEPFPIICEISENDYDSAKNHIDKELKIILTAYAMSEPDIYDDDDDFNKKTGDAGISIASQSFLASPQTMIIDEEEFPVPVAMITGVVGDIECLHYKEKKDACDSFFKVKIEMLGIVFVAVFKDMKLKDLKPGNIISCTYYMVGHLPGKED